MSALFARENAIIPLTPAADQSAKEGYLVDIASNTATVSSSATTPARGVIMDGSPTTGKSHVGILGALKGTVRMKITGAVTKGDRLQQAADGSLVTDAAAGARVLVGVALESGVSGDLIEVATHAPLTMS